MFKTIALILVLGTISSAASAQRGVCPLGDEVNQDRPCLVQGDRPGGRAIVTPRMQARQVTGNFQDRLGRQGRARSANQAGWGQGNGRRRGACRGPRQATGQGLGRGQGQGNGRGRGASRGPRQGVGQWPANGRRQGFGRNAVRGQAAVPQQGNVRGWGRGTRRLQQTSPATTSDAAVAPTIPPDEARAWASRLQTVLEAELYAKEYYQTAARALNGFRRFQNLSRAENNHANAIAYAIGLLGGTPDWVQNQPITPPQSVAEADAHCREIELHVIEVYEGLIADAPTSQLLAIFQNIQQANYQHLSVVGG